MQSAIAITPTAKKLIFIIISIFLIFYLIVKKESKPKVNYSHQAMLPRKLLQRLRKMIERFAFWLFKSLPVEIFARAFLLF